MECLCWQCLCHVPFSTALGSTVLVTTPVCCWQLGTRCPRARGCPPRLPSSHQRLNCCVFLGQTAKTASAALRKGQLSPQSGLSHQEMPKGWKFPSCPKPQPPACDIGDGCQPESIHGPEGPPHFQEIPDSLEYPSAVWPSPKDGSMAWSRLKSPHIHPLPQN